MQYRSAGMHARSGSESITQREQQLQAAGFPAEQDATTELPCGAALSMAATAPVMWRERLPHRSAHSVYPDPAICVGYLPERIERRTGRWRRIPDKLRLRPGWKVRSLHCLFCRHYIVRVRTREASALENISGLQVHGGDAHRMTRRAEDDQQVRPGAGPQPPDLPHARLLASAERKGLPGVSDCPIRGRARRIGHQLQPSRSRQLGSSET